MIGPPTCTIVKAIIYIFGENVLPERKWIVLADHLHYEILVSHHLIWRNCVTPSVMCTVILPGAMPRHNVLSQVIFYLTVVDLLFHHSRALVRNRLHSNYNGCSMCNSLRQNGRNVNSSSPFKISVKHPFLNAVNAMVLNIMKRVCVNVIIFMKIKAT